MRRFATSVVCAGLLLGVAACGEDTPRDNATAGANNQAASNEMAMNDPTNPYAQSEMDMHDGMMAAKGANVSDTWALKMIEHHRGALTMSEVLLSQDPNSRFAPMARTTIEEQGAEIRRLEQMLQAPSAQGGQSSAATSSAPRAATRAAPRAQPKAATNATPKASNPAADPQAGDNMSNMTNGM